MAVSCTDTEMGHHICCNHRKKKKVFGGLVVSVTEGGTGLGEHLSAQFRMETKVWDFAVYPSLP